MKQLRAIALLFAAVLLFVAAGASALDVGGNFNSRTDLRDEQTTLGNTASLWARNNPITGPDPMLRYVIEAEATSDVSWIDGEQETDLYADLALANVRATLPGMPADQAVSEVTVGRYAFAEETGLIFSDRVDGSLLRIDLPVLSVQATAGYSGLIDGRTTGILMTGDDLADVADDDERAGSRRIVTALSATVVQLADRHDLSAGVLAQWDTRDGDEAGEVLDSQYAYLAADGAVTGNLYYNAGLIGSANQREGEAFDQETGMALAAIAEGELFLGAQDNHIVTLTSRWASGADDPFDAYVPISADGFDTLGPADVSDSFALGLDYEVRPFEGMEGAAGEWLGLSGYSVADWPADFEGDEAYRSLEAGARLAARPFSDLGGQLRLAGISHGDEPETINLQGRIEVSASF